MCPADRRGSRCQDYVPFQCSLILSSPNLSCSNVDLNLPSRPFDLVNSLLKLSQDPTCTRFQTNMEAIPLTWWLQCFMKDTINYLNNGGFDTFPYFTRNDTNVNTVLSLN